MVGISGDGAEALVEIQISLRTIFVEQGGHVKLRGSLSICHTAFYLHKSLYQGHTVAHHGVAHSGNLYIVLHRLHHSRRRHSRGHSPAAKNIHHRARCASRIDKHAHTFGERCQKRGHCAVILRPHAFRCKVSAGFVGKLGFGDKQHFVGLRQIQIGGGNRRVANIIATYVQNPRYLVESRHENGRSTFAFNGAENIFDLPAGALSGIFTVVDKYLAVGKRRTVAPKAANRVEMAIEIDTGRFEARRKSLQRRSAEQHSVNTDTRTCRQGGTQECRYRRRFSKTVLHQLYARAVELRGRLNEISRISPQQGTVERHNKVARRACKARQPTANLPVCRQIFTQVRIGLRHHHSGNPRLPHHISQRVQTRNIHIIHISQY